MNITIGVKVPDRIWNESNPWSEPTPTNGSRGELSRLINAAVVNPAFCRLLLSSPAVALATGYNGKPFSLAPDERTEILSTQAPSLAYLARRLTEQRNGNGRG